MKFVFLLLITWSSAVVAGDFPLREYVQQPDPSFNITSIDQVSGEPGTTVYQIKFDSLSWRSPEEVSRQVWRHTMIMAIPDDLQNDAALLVVNGGRNATSEQPSLFRPKGNKGIADEIAVMTKAIVAELQMIPNQPLEFNGDGQGRKEDDLIAYSWARYLESLDPLWVAQFPMTKASVRAMDVMATVARNVLDRKLERFVVTGASKRGWTSWLVAAVDPRVVGVVPIVIDVVNMVPSMKHHHAALGFWSDAIKDYVNHGIMDQLDTPEVAQLAEMIDPYHLREHLTEPKFVINAANDQFFVPDSGQFYLDRMPGKMMARYVPNSGHFVNNFDAINSMMIFFDAVTQDKELPSLSWQRSSDWQMLVRIEGEPKRVVLWEATSLLHRDFRFTRDMPRYLPTEIAVNSSGEYTIAIDKPVAGYKAYFVEVQFGDGPLGYLKLTTDVNVAKVRASH